MSTDVPESIPTEERGPPPTEAPALAPDEEPIRPWQDVLASWSEGDRQRYDRLTNLWSASKLIPRELAAARAFNRVRRQLLAERGERDPTQETRVPTFEKVPKRRKGRVVRVVRKKKLKPKAKPTTPLF